MLVVGWVGDSRAYWLPDDGGAAAADRRRLVGGRADRRGVPRAEAESGPQAHAITRWLGVDAPDHTPRTASLDLDGPGWLLVCSDGLWNYCSEAQDLGHLVAEHRPGRRVPTPLPLAEALVDWANAQGGQDNITVALARVGPARAHRRHHPA